MVPLKECRTLFVLTVGWVIFMVVLFSWNSCKRYLREMKNSAKIYQLNSAQFLIVIGWNSWR